MKIIPIVYGKTTLPESMIFEGSTSEVRRPIVLRVYLIETEGRRILVDAGCDTMPGFILTDFLGPVRALAEVGVTPPYITDVILTHHHHDHIDGIRHFKSARVYLCRDEYEAAKKHLSGIDDLVLFDERIEVCEGITAIRAGGHTRGSSIVSVTADGREYVICGDECYARECLERKIPTGVSVSPERSRAFIEEYSNEKYTVLVTHEP